MKPWLCKYVSFVSPRSALQSLFDLSKCTPRLSMYHAMELPTCFVYNHAYRIYNFWTIVTKAITNLHMFTKQHKLLATQAIIKVNLKPWKKWHSFESNAHSGQKIQMWFGRKVHEKKAPEEAQIWAPAEAILSTSRGDFERSGGDFEHQPRRFWAPAEAISSTSACNWDHQRKHKSEHQPRRFWAPAEAILSTSGGDFEHQPRRFWAPATCNWGHQRTHKFEYRRKKNEKHQKVRFL